MKLKKENIELRVENQMLREDETFPADPELQKEYDEYVQKAEAGIKNLQNDIEVLRTENERGWKEYDALERKHDEAVKKVKTQSEELIKLRNEVGRLRLDCGDLQIEKNDLLEQIQQLKDQAKELELGRDETINKLRKYIFQFEKEP